MIKIYPQLQENDKVKIIPFRSVLDCYIPSASVKQASVPKNWPHIFYVHTIERTYSLCAKSEAERKMWMAGFRYVIASTLTVQIIMKHNNQI